VIRLYFLSFMDLRVSCDLLLGCRGNRIHCTLWDNYAEQLNQFFGSHDPNLPVVVLIQMCKLKKYFGAMGVSNAFYGTKLFLNADIPEVSDYMGRLITFCISFIQFI
jgi:hypothetical protein